MVNKNTQKNHHRGAKRDGRMHKFFFLKPLPNMNADELSSKLLGIDGIEEVYVTEGDYGFLIKAKSSSNESDLGNRIAENMRSKYGYAISYYSFKKR
ncbi:MAG: hypothetical protein QXR58_00650 [Candidatus Micrarchaeaceae archaeon]